MKKILNGTTKYNGKPARIKATITDENGYISITGEITPHRCRKPHAFGCVHEEIAKAFPKLQPFMWLHLVNLDGSVMHEVANTLYFLANDDTEAAQKHLHCTDEEILRLSAFVRYGLHREKTVFNYGETGKKAYHVTGDGVQLFERELKKYGFTAKRKAAIIKFYRLLNTL